MPSIMKATIFFASMAACVLAVVPARAQQGKNAAPAPLPSQIVNGRRVFIANAAPEVAFLYNGGPNRFYNQFYAAMKSWGRYELVGSPAQADLVFEISSSNPFIGEQIYAQPAARRALTDPQLRLTIIDPATRITLWAFIEHVEPALLQGNRDKNFDLAFASLVNDVRNVAGAPPLAAANGKK